MNRHRVIDPVIAAALGLLAFAIGSWYDRLPDVQRSASYYQETFGPAVMLACGHGLASTGDLSSQPALRDFLERRVDAFDCGALVPGPGKLTALQSASRYLMSAVGLAWFVGGISWSGLWWVFALLFAIVAVLTYLSARLILNRALAAAVSLAIMTSSMQISALPHLRDYSKAPFFTAMVLITLTVVMRPLSSRALYLWSALAGLLIGIAFGVRFDMTLFLAIFVGAVVFLTPGTLQTDWRRRIAAVALCGAAFVLAAMPVLLSFQLGNNSWHVVILGLAEPHQVALDLRRSAYHLGTLYNDSFIAATVNSYWQRGTGTATVWPLDTPEYGAAAAGYFREVARQFPADMVMRAWAAIYKVFRLPFEGSVALPPSIVPDSLAGRVLGARAAALAWINWLAPWAAVIPIAALLAMARFHLRATLLGVSGCLFLGGMSSLQFQIRHVFHLELIAMLLVATVVQSATERVRRWRAAPSTRPGSWTPVLILTTVLVALAVTPTWALRLHQQSSVRDLFTRYGAAVTPATPVLTMADEATTLATPAAADAAGAASLSTQFFAADFGGAHCDYDEIDGVIRYRAPTLSGDFSRPFSVHIPPSPETTRLWFAAYSLRDAQLNGRYEFAGVEIPTKRAACLVGLARLNDVRAFPLLVDADLEPGWESAPLYLTLNGLEHPLVVRPTTYSWPPDADFTRSQLTRPVAPLGAVTDYVARIATASPSITVQGIASPTAYLITWPPSHQPSSALLIATGELKSGGVVLGLERNGAWASQVPITVAGRFRVAIQPPGDGQYRVVIANNREGGGLWTSLSVDSLGWARNGVE